MSRRFVFPACLLLLALAPACAPPGPHADNVPQAAVDTDYNDCETRAFVSTALLKSAGEAADKRQEIIDACMQEKGYKVK